MYKIVSKQTRYKCTRCNSYYDSEDKLIVCPVCRHDSKTFVRKVGPIKRLLQNLSGYK